MIAFFYPFFIFISFFVSLSVFSPSLVFGEAGFSFVDKDGDLLCDAPTDPNKLKDPDILYYTISPEGGRKYNKPRKEHEKLMAAIARKTGKQVKWLPVASSVEEIEMMRDGKLHIAGFSTGTTGFAVNLAGFLPLAVKGDKEKKNEIFGYRLQIIVNSNSPYRSLHDLKGEVIAHTSAISNSGNMAPRALLPDFGLIAGETYQVVYSGKHRKSIMGVVEGRYPAAAVASSILNRMISEKAVASKDIRILYSSPKFPTLAMGCAYNLKPERIEQIKEAFFEHIIEPNVEKEYVPLSYKRDWKIIRHIAKFSGNSYTEEGLAKMMNTKKQ